MTFKRLLLLCVLLLADISSFSVPPEAPPSDPLAIAKSLNLALKNVAKQVSPSVAVLRVATKEGQPKSSGVGQFNDFLKKNAPGYQSGKQPKDNQDYVFNQSGSGVIISKNGYILTNRHVIDDAIRIKVYLQDGRNFTGELRGYDEHSDLAVVKITATNLSAALIADSDKIEVGEFAIAVGAPFSLKYSVTVGHISALRRTSLFDKSEEDQNFIQTDASINPGNSGGPLVNIEGKVIGINTLIYGKRNAGIGFAIPSNFAMKVAGMIIRDGKVTRAWLGVSALSLEENPEYRKFYKDTRHGVIVKKITPDSPASNSNLKPLDLILAVDKTPIITAQDLKTAISFNPAGRPVILNILRNNRKMNIKVTLKFKDEKTQITSSIKGKSDLYNMQIGLGVSKLNKDSSKKLGIPNTQGLLITRISKNSPSDKAGLEEGDVITEINQTKITSIEGFKRAIDQADLKKGLILTIYSQGGYRFEIIKI